MILNKYFLGRVISSVLLVISPVLFGCSAFSGGSSSDPMVNAQQQQIRTVEEEVRAQKRRTDEAEQLYKREKNLLDAKKSELKAAQRLLNVYEKQAKQR